MSAVQLALKQFPVKKFLIEFLLSLKMTLLFSSCKNTAVEEFLKVWEPLFEKKTTCLIHAQSLTASIGANEIHAEDVWLSFAVECTNVAFINISAFTCGVTSDVAIYAIAIICSRYIAA